jgi:dethiobiotin synthetase
LLCRDKYEEVVEYALSRNLSPTMVAQYELQLPNKKVIKTKLQELTDDGYWENNSSTSDE